VTRAAAAAAALVALTVSAASKAHDALPLAIALDQVTVEDYTVRMRVPPAAAGQAPQLAVGKPCAMTRRQGETATIRCPSGTPPSALELTYGSPARPVPIVVRLSYLGQEPRTIAAAPGTTRVQLPSRETAPSVFSGYFVAGLEHIAGGFDHLLFLLCLMLIAGTPRRILLTVTGFTLGHALTISLAALGAIRIHSGLVEVLIALSIVFVAAEIARNRRTTLTWRYPALVATLFGLLHGLGFAGALREIGLPEAWVPVSLAAFNLGIEAGQVVFAVTLLALAWLARRVVPRLPRSVRPALSPSAVAAWPIGLIAGTWFFIRASSL
jgi:hydrogenase/urease accessory protein HupE